MAEEEVAAASSPVPSDHKRKLDDLEPEAPEQAVSSPPPAETLADLKSNEDSNENDAQKDLEVAAEVSDSPEAKRPRLDEEIVGSENGHLVEQLDEPPTETAQEPLVENLQTEVAEYSSIGILQEVNKEQTPMENQQTGNAQLQSVENPEVDNTQHDSGEDLQQPTSGIPQQGDLSFAQQQPTPEIQTMSRKMDVPNNKVILPGRIEAHYLSLAVLNHLAPPGLCQFLSDLLLVFSLHPSVGALIGKAGDTIRFLQSNSGAKIQITRDADADPNSSSRPVELLGSLESINKAEKMIKDVIVEAEAGGSPSLVAMGFSIAQAGGATEQIQIDVPNEKVGVIIGKGGQTIKNLQTKSGARIQLIPQNLPEGDQSKDRTVRVTGNKKQIEMAKEMIKEVMNQPVRSATLSSFYNRQNYRPRGPTGAPQWGPRAPPAHPTGYDYQRRGMFPSQNPQYPPPSHGSYPPQQPTPRSSFNAGWDQRPPATVQAPQQSGGYDYYGQGGHVADAPSSGPVSTPAFGPASAVGPPPTQVNYNYGQPANYSQSAHPQQSYGHGYDEPKYENQAPTQHAYGGQGNSQPAVYPQMNTQPGYAQQPYGKTPSYGMPAQGPPPQSYGPPRTGQPGDVPYQGPISSTQSYGPNAQSQQSYGPTQQTYPYGGSTPATNDGYNQPPTGPASGTGYPQQGSQAVSNYSQLGGQPAPGYAQGGPAGGYGPYSSSQPGYSEQPVQNNTGYGYQGPSDTGYNSAPASAYGAPSSGQPGYVQVQPTPNQASYDQMPQSGGYGGVPGSAPVAVGYAQYDSTQIYGGHH
ncbi:hypothetical protein HHK36_030291 [Tetracentron sinense]|uniref:K Homology domain-containing protein n=1 Tax=Tetracentron sinense TaxID=13715 RepID=A0A834YC78_TETSI|nr:hypothetical protein HHK36_030291 [Tetracentron sinense]